jgi:hypothetical protein
LLAASGSLGPTGVEQATVNAETATIAKETALSINFFIEILLVLLYFRLSPAI